MKFVFTLTVLFFHAALGDVDLQNLEIPNLDLDDFAVIKEKCDQAGGPGTYDKFKAAKDSFQTCVTGFANATVVKNEVEEAKKTGSMDEVFGKYCGKRPKLQACVDDLTKSLRPCLDEEGKKALNTTLNVLKQLGDFLCYRDGDRIAMFVAEGGVECIQSRTEGIKDCVNSTFKIQPATMNTNSLPSLLMDKKKCDDLGRLQTCVVEELEKCHESTPANIIDALFKFIKRSACTSKNKRSLQMHSVTKRSTAILEYAKDNVNQFRYMFKKKCDENAPDGGYEALNLALESASHCIRNRTRDAPFLVASAAIYKENIHRCVEKLLETTEACLPKEEKYWPKDYLATVKNLIDFVYDNKNALVHLDRAELYSCFQNFKHNSAKKELMKCFNVAEDNCLRKEIFCGRLTGMTDCLYKQLQKRCSPDIEIDRLLRTYAKALTATCQE